MLNKIFLVGMLLSLSVTGSAFALDDYTSLNTSGVDTQIDKPKPPPCGMENCDCPLKMDPKTKKLIGCGGKLSDGSIYKPCDTCFGGIVGVNTVGMGDMLGVNVGGDKHCTKVSK